MGTSYFYRDDADLKFVLGEYLDLDRLLSYEPYADFSTDDLYMVLDEAFKMAREVISPSLQESDREGCRWDNGRVATPPSFREIWRTFYENGWGGVSASPEFGGQGLPHVMGGLVSETFCGANLSFMSYPGLAVGNGRLIENFGTDGDKARFVEKMYTGVWGGTMCLTEDDAGSDVGWLRTRAIPGADPADPKVYKIEGAKRFITCGEHDLTENIIHLVLARIEGAPAGTKGVSLFIVPKIWVNEDGYLGQPNDVFCTGIEHKMGIHGSSTCQLSFGENGGCRGILLGEPHSGMAKMFQMMNEARIGCGLQALGIAASAYDTARAYAAQRVQGPLFTKRDGDRAPIIQHEDVRRMLMRLKSGVEGMRALTAKLLFFSDAAEHDQDEAYRKSAADQVELLTPLIKAYNSDLGFELCRDAVQVLGGAGYCADFPAEQYARDIKIVSIWEGTSYIQSLDLVGRKLGLQNGQVFMGWVNEVMTFTGKHKEHVDLKGDMKLLYKASQVVGDFAGRFMQYFKDGRAQLIPLYATRFLECFAETAMAHCLLEQALVAERKLDACDPASKKGLFYRGKLASARFFCRNILTNTFARHASLQTEDMTAALAPEGIF